MIRICELPTEWWGNARTDREAELAAIAHLVATLSNLRDCRCEFLDRPDVTERQKIAADSRYRQVESGLVIGIECKRFVDPDDREASSHLAVGKRFRAKGSLRPLEYEGQQFAALSIGDPRDELRLLRDFIVRSIRRGQLQACEADERLLLIIDGRHIYPEFAGPEFVFAEADRESVDHTFLLAPGAGGVTPTPSRILQVW